MISQSLYNIYTENIMRKTEENFEGGITTGGKKITNLRLFDDTVVTSNSKEELIKLLSDLKRESDEMGLLLNAKRQRLWW